MLRIYSHWQSTWMLAHMPLLWCLVMDPTSYASITYLPKYPYSGILLTCKVHLLVRSSIRCMLQEESWLDLQMSLLNPSRVQNKPKTPVLRPDSWVSMISRACVYKMGNSKGIYNERTSMQCNISWLVLCPLAWLGWNEVDCMHFFNRRWMICETQ